MSTFDSSEIWKPIPGYEGLYEASSYGRIRSLDKSWKSRFAVAIFPGRVLVQIEKKNGYLVVSLSKNNKPKQLLVHRLVLSAFDGECPSGMEACHKNGVRSDARIENLRWDTRKLNHQDKKLHGTYQIGEKASNVKLTDEIVRSIRTMNLTPVQAQKEFGLSRTNAKRIVRFESWKHIHAE